MIDQGTLRMRSGRKKPLYEHNKNKAPYQKNWKDMKKNKQEQRKKGFRPSKFKNGNSYQQGKPRDEPLAKRPPVECWICKENHFSTQLPCKKNNLHNIQEASTIGDVGGSVQRIYASLDGRKDGHKSQMIEVEGNIANKTITILIYFGASNSYIAPSLVEKCHLKKSKLETSSLVQLATRAKRKIAEFVIVCPS